MRYTSELSMLGPLVLLVLWALFIVVGVVIGWLP